MKRYLLLFLAMAFLFSVVGCTKKNTTKPDRLPVPETGVIAKEGVPDFILEDMNLGVENYYAHSLEHVLYLTAAMGIRPSSGYEIYIREYSDNGDGTWDVFLETKEPGKDDIVLTVITYPVAYVRLYPQTPVTGIRFFEGTKKLAEVAVKTVTAPQNEEMISLYFGSMDAYLREEIRPVLKTAMAGNVTQRAETVLNELLKGTMAMDGTLNIIPPGTEVTEIIYTEAEKLLQVTFTSQFAEVQGSAGEMLAVYSVVNSLTSLPGIEMVTIVIENGQLTHLDQLERMPFNADIIK